MKLKTPRFDKGRILVVGDMMLDRFWHGDTSRISPEAPVPVVRVSEEEVRPGGAANVAVNAAALGAATSVMGIIGKDDNGRKLNEQLMASGVVSHVIEAEGEPTITKLRVISRHQQLIRLDFEDVFDRGSSVEMEKKLDGVLGDADVLVLSDYAKGTLHNVEVLIAAGRAAGKQVLVDPKGSDFERYRGASLLTPNLAEFEAVVGRCHNERELVEKGQALINKLELGALLVTRSEHGMTLLRAEGAEQHFPAHAKEVFDVTGAGDTVISTLACALAAGEQLESAVALANVAAGIVVGKLGTATVSAPELKHYLEGDYRPECGVVSEDQLAIALEECRANGETIVFTNGCFDILHAGHVGYLQSARSLGNRLVLAVNDDDSVRRLKGNGRPVNTVERRMAVLAGLEAVDWVVPFSEDTPERLIHLMKPDVLVKGGDYTPDTVVGAEFVRSYGGRVELMPFLDKCSTTLIVDKIRETSEPSEQDT